MHLKSIAFGAVAMVAWVGGVQAHECSVKGNADRVYVKTHVVPTSDPAVEMKLPDLIGLKNPRLSPTTFQQLEHSTVRLALRVPIGNQVFAEGARVWIEGWLVHASCEKDDGDYHLQLATTSNHPTECVIVEVPDPDFLTTNNPIRANAGSVRAAVRQIYGGNMPNGSPPQPIRVQVEGQLFLDAHHYSFKKPNGGGGGGRGKAGCPAKNLWEIHPITAIRQVSSN